MLVLDRLIGLASPEAALRRAVRLSDQGKAAEAFPLLTRSAKAGIAEAEYRVACCYLEGAGVPASRIEGARWLERAAGHGHVEAQTLLAGLCVHGLAGDVNGDRPERLFAEEEPGEPDFASALKWARPAAEAGSAKAQAVLAYVLTCGPEEMRDLEAAHRWYQRSAAAGCPEGCLGYALSLAPRTQDEAGRHEVAEHLRRAAEAELPTAIYLLAVLTEQGVGVARDPGGRGGALPARGRARATLGAIALGAGADGGARRRAGSRARRILAAPRGIGRRPGRRGIGRRSLCQERKAAAQLYRGGRLVPPRRRGRAHRRGPRAGLTCI